MADSKPSDRILDFEALTTNPWARVLIAGLQGKANSSFTPTALDTASKSNSNVLVGFVSQPLSFGGANTYTSPLDAASDALNQAWAAIEVAGSKTGVGKWLNEKFGGGKGLAQYSLKSFEQTASVWTGSATPEFAVKLIFVALRETDDVTIPIQSLMRSFYPTRESLGKGKMTLMRAPLGYGFQPNANGTMVPYGTLVLQIGKWFRASGLIPVRADGVTFSKECILSGKPLYSECTVVLRPWRMISYNEFAGFFVDSQRYTMTGDEG